MQVHVKVIAWAFPARNQAGEIVNTPECFHWPLPENCLIVKPLFYFLRGTDRRQ